MTRTAPFTIAMLLSLAAVCPAQPSGVGGNCGNPGVGETLLAMEANLGQGTQWYCPSAANNVAATATRFRLHAPKGTWSTIVPRVYISGSGPNADQLRQTYGWLNFNAPLDPGTVFPGWSGQPSIVVDWNRVWWFIQNGVLDPYSLTISPLAVRDLFVPILEDPTNTAATHNTRVWESRPQGWLADQSGNLVGPTMSGIWSGMLVDSSQSGNSDLFSLEGIARTAIMLQAPDLATANAFMSGLDFFKALESGLSIDFQAVCMIDPSGVTPGTTDLNAPGLGLPALPNVTFSPPITITVAIAAPATNGPGGGLGFVNIQNNQQFTFHARGIIPLPSGPAEMIFRDATNNALPAVPIMSAATLRNPFRMQVVPPSGVAAGTTVEVLSGVPSAGTGATAPLTTIVNVLP